MNQTKKRWQNLLFRYGASGFTLTLVLGVAGAYFLDPGFQSNVKEGWSLILQGDRVEVTRFFQRFGYWGPLFILVFMFLQMVTIVLPSWLLMVVAILGYGPVWGTLLSVFGITLVAVTAYGIGWLLGRKTLSRMLGPEREDSLNRLISRYGIGAVALFRLSPFLSNDLISFVAGMVNMKKTHFLLGTLAGIIPLSVAIAVFSEDSEELKEGLVWLGAGGIFLYGVYIWLDRRSKHKEDIK